MLRPMVIAGLTVDPLTNSPIVILKEIGGERTLPIWIGLLEATAIASELEGIKFSRPMLRKVCKSTRLGRWTAGVPICMTGDPVGNAV